MKFKNAFSVIGLSIFLVAACCQAFGQNTVSPQKRELIKELLTVTEATKLAENASREMLAQMDREMPKIMKMVLMQDTRLTPEQRKEVEDQIEKSSGAAVKRFGEKLIQKLNYAELLETVSLELYDKYFTEAELKDMIAFYKTPTGKKTIEVMPKLMADIMQKTSELVLPKVMSLINEIMSAEFKIKK